MAPLVWLITGTSSGLGAELARAVLRRGDKLIAAARAPISRIADLEREGATTMELDVTWKEADIKTAVARAIEVYGQIDVVVPNAGYAEFICLEDLTQQQWDKQLSVNWFGCTALVAAVIPHFRSRRTGTVAFMNSIYSHDSGPFNAPYSTTKHAMTAYSKTINEELSPFNIRSISFNIGVIKTGFLLAANWVKPNHDDYTARFDEFQTYANSLVGKQPGDPTKCVERIVDVVRKEGFAEGKPTPHSVPLGSDANAFVRQRAADLVRICDEWKELSAAVDF